MKKLKPVLNIKHKAAFDEWQKMYCDKLRWYSLEESAIIYLFYGSVGRISHMNDVEKLLDSRQWVREMVK